jgi:D-3-phosphoglycerate dehydrogenase/C-terminal binding protein
MYRVLITDSIEPPPDIEQEVLKGIAEVRCLQVTPEHPLDDLVSEADALIVYHECSVTEKTIAFMPKCRVIVRGGVGYDNVDVIAAAARSIPVCNIPDYGVDEVADHALGLLLALNRGIVASDRRLRESLRPWDRRAVEPVYRLCEMTLGIVGCGRIGSAMARRARALKMRVLAYDPYLRPGMEKVLDVERVDWEQLLLQSHIVSVHTPLTNETRHLFDQQAISKMRPGSMLINTARGAVVDTDAVADALLSGHLAGAAIDVLSTEPPTTNSKIIRVWQEHPLDIQLIITPHVAYYSTAAIHEIRRKGAEEIRRVFLGERPWNCVNLDR